MLGTIIGEKYRLERSIGTGGMGEVFEARHLVTNRAVAVKLLYEQRPANEAVASDRFRREAHAAGSLDAEHIVQVFDAGVDRDTRRRYLVMQLLHGESLHDLIKRIGPLPPRVAFCIAGQAALGLAKAHAAGVIHRDIKPANIFLSVESDEIVAKVLDFGIAKVEELDGPDSNTPAEAIVGSPHYMSPEQAQGLPTLDHRSDLFSLGAVLYRLLSGQTPHPSADTLVRLMFAICSEPARPLNEVAPWVPPEMAELVERAISIPPDERFSSAGEMAHAIADVVGDLRIAPTDITPLSDDDRAGIVRASYPPQSSRGWDQTLQGAETHRPRSFRNPGKVSAISSAQKGSLLTAVMGAIAMALVIVAGMSLWRSRGASHAATATASANSAKAAQTSAASLASAAERPSSESSATTRTVWVRVQPASADEISVDGRRVKITPTGYVEVTGDLGSKHEVSVRVGGRTRTTHVIITPEGAFPDAATFSDGAATSPEHAKPDEPAVSTTTRAKRRSKHSEQDSARDKPDADATPPPARPRTSQSTGPTPLGEPVPDPFGGFRAFDGETKD